ncbi:MAG: NAD(P)H-dependent oxidoreductase [Candidatus Methanomethylicia archaeon]|uniref:NADPH-dependent FMN reductase n=1 Tax=Saccharolobus sp. TaxID=2100761 RepID=UPI0031668512
MPDKIKVLGIVGSLRKNSYNRLLLLNAKSLLPEDATLEIFDRLGEFPLFNQDLENDPPQIVKEFKKKIRESDAILIATPEYNYSIPGVLKNALDWAARPYGDNPFEGKPVAIMSASIGMLGGARAQYHLRQVLVYLNTITINKPEVFVSFAHKKFDEKGNLVDEEAKKYIAELLRNLVNTARLLKHQYGLIRA